VDEEGEVEGLVEAGGVGGREGFGGFLGLVSWDVITEADWALYVCRYNDIDIMSTGFIISVW
jgi:hypothetical protein